MCEHWTWVNNTHCAVEVIPLAHHEFRGEDWRGLGAVHPAATELTERLAVSWDLKRLHSIRTRSRALHGGERLG